MKNQLKKTVKDINITKKIYNVLFMQSQRYIMQTRPSQKFELLTVYVKIVVFFIQVTGMMSDALGT